MKSKTIIHKIIGIIAIVIFSLISLNNSLFVHVHQLDNGTIISHAHPFNKSDTAANGQATHKHNSTEIIFYQILNALLFIIAASFSVVFVFRFSETLYSSFYNFIVNGFNSYSIRVRPPPVCFV